MQGTNAVQNGHEMELFAACTGACSNAGPCSEREPLLRSLAELEQPHHNHRGVITQTQARALFQD